ncbi:MAG: xylulokinase, partial [Verrucomicrobiales bacterium]|nr:xylulokinase [Verrucomicrobiales bacterium]
MIMIFIGIDSGTQSTKALALDAETGEILASSQEAYDILGSLPNGHMEQDPCNWINAVRNVIGSCVDALGERKLEIKGIGVSGQQHGLVVLDENDDVIRPAKLWCDTSTIDQCQQFTRDFEGDAGLIELTGNTVLPGYTVPKILWMKQKEADNFAKIKTVLLPHDYINFWLTGVKRMEYGDASGTGMLDVRKREWCDQIIDYVDPALREMLPPLGSSLEPHGQLRSALIDEWGLAEG